jgi:hypothetical protein
VRQTLPAELPVPSDRRMIRLFAIRTLAQSVDGHRHFVTARGKFLCDLALPL